MKNILKITTVLFLVLTFFACSNDENQALENIESKTLTFDDLFDKVSSMKVDSENIIYIDYQWNKKNNLVTILETKVQKPDFFILETTESQNTILSKKKYTVSCDNGGDGSDDWSEGCNNKFSCGALIADCLDEGGCAEICTNKMVYIPKTKTFHLIKE